MTRYLIAELSKGSANKGLVEYQRSPLCAPEAETAAQQAWTLEILKSTDSLRRPS